MDASSDVETGARESLTALLAVYHHLARAVDPSLSNTARFLRTGEPTKARERLLEEAAEALAVTDGEHTHAGDKTRLAIRLLEERGLDIGNADLLLELNQIAYWALLYGFRKGRPADVPLLREALDWGAASTETAGDLLEALQQTTTVAGAFRLIGHLAHRRGIPLTLWARLDLADMANRGYLQEFINGL